jgi:membrane fusion protein (multidrug efflux system)
MRRLDVAEGAAPPPPGFARRFRLPLMLSVPVLILILLGALWYAGRDSVSTDNAQVNANVVGIAPEVGGRLLQVNVRENQTVKAGDILYTIDPAPYRIALLQADAAVGTARLQIAQLEGGYQSKVADIDSKASDVSLARQNFERQQSLLKAGFTTRANYDAAKAALDAALAQREVAQSDAVAARAMIGMPGGAHPQVEAAIAARDKAALDLQRTILRSPLDGTVTQSDKLNPGAMAVATLPNIQIVGHDYWIDANFKETQLPRIRIGQTAEVEMDAVPGRTFKAHVIGVGAGTGSQFSLLPAQNATGNWVKVTQRVPVRLRLDELPDRALVAGWSARVTVNVR